MPKDGGLDESRMAEACKLILKGAENREYFLYLLRIGNNH
jgi:hypothetical protein